jgi:hypothetical protein
MAWAPSTPAQKSLDEEADVQADPCAGWEIGTCEVIRRLNPGEPDALLALRGDGAAGTMLVVLRRTHDAVEDLFNRAHQLSRIRHPNVARVFDCEVDEDDVFWVTEFSPGASIDEVAQVCHRKGMAMPLGVALGAIVDAAFTLDQLRGGPMPRAVHGQDVIVTFQGATKLACAALTTHEPVQLRERVGFAPEIFALGALLYECIGGQRVSRPPSRPEWVPPSHFNISVPPELDDAVMRALYVSGASPFRTARELGLALKEAAGEFIWRESQRGDFVSNLFQTRWRRVQVLLAGCFDGRSTSSTSIPRARLSAVMPPPLPPRPSRALPPPLPPRAALAPRPSVAILPPVIRIERRKPAPAPRPIPNRKVQAELGRGPVRHRPRRWPLLIAVWLALAGTSVATGAIAPADFHRAAEWLRAVWVALGPC